MHSGEEDYDLSDHPEWSGSDNDDGEEGEEGVQQTFDQALAAAVAAKDLNAVGCIATRMELEDPTGYEDGSANLTPDEVRAHLRALQEVITDEDSGVKEGPMIRAAESLKELWQFIGVTSGEETSRQLYVWRCRALAQRAKADLLEAKIREVQRKEDKHLEIIGYNRELKQRIKRLDTTLSSTETQLRDAKSKLARLETQ